MYGKLAGQRKLPYREVHDSKLFLQRSNTCENIIKKVCPFTISVGDVDRVYEMNNRLRNKRLYSERIILKRFAVN